MKVSSFIISACPSSHAPGTATMIFCCCCFDWLLLSFFNKSSLNQGLCYNRNRCEDQCPAGIGRKMLVLDGQFAGVWTCGRWWLRGQESDGWTTLRTFLSFDGLSQAVYVLIYHYNQMVKNLEITDIK